MQSGRARKLVVGCGYLGARVARLWLETGDEVYAVTRSAARAEQFRREGYRPIVADITRAESLAGLPEAATVLLAVGYDRLAGPSLREVYVSGVQNVLAALPGGTGRVISISSTGVYGDAAGEWVDEATPCRPRREGGQACLAAEQVLAAHPLGQRAIVLRLAGIYGPGRIPRREALASGEPIPAPAEGFLNLIHVDDAAQVVLAAEARGRPPRTYVVADGHPGTRREYYTELARLIGAPAPRFVDPPPASHLAARAASDRRASNARLLAELGIELRYPSFREGLAAIVGA